MRMAFAITSAVVVLAAVWFALTPADGGGRLAEAHGVVDQSQTQSNSSGFNNSQPMMQSFVPTASTLAGVDIKGQVFGVDDPNYLWTVAIRRGFATGPIIALKTMIGLTATEAVRHVDFVQPVAVTAGDTYWLEAAGEGNLLQWAFQMTGDPYAVGQPDAALRGAFTGSDRYFVTYSSPPPPPITPTPRPTRTPRP